MIALVVLLGLAYYLVKLFTFRIVWLPQFDIFYIAYSTFGLSRIYQIVSIAQELIRVILIVVILTIINLINLVKFRKRFKQRQIGVMGASKLANQTSGTAAVSGVGLKSFSNLPPSQTPSSQTLAINEQNAERNNEATRSLTKMVLVTSFIRIICEIPFLIAFALVAVGSFNVVVNNIFYAAASLIYVPPLCDLFVYYFFNKNFKSILNKYYQLIFKMKF